MKIKNNANVYTQDGKKVGGVSRVVMNPENYEVTHLVVEKGILFTENKVVPIELVVKAGEDEINLSLKEDELDQLRNLVETHFIPGDTTRAYQGSIDMAAAAPPIYWYPPAGSVWWTQGGSPGYSMPRFTSRRVMQIPEGTVALEDGAKVYSRDGEHIGDIVEVLTDSETNRATHLIISEGFLLKEKKIAPTAWVTQVSEEEVHLSVNGEFFDELPEYEAGKG